MAPKKKSTSGTTKKKTSAAEKAPEKVAEVAAQPAPVEPKAPAPVKAPEPVAVIQPQEPIPVASEANLQPAAAGGDAAESNQILQMTLKERRELRMMRFVGGGEAGTDVSLLMGQLEAEKKKKEERAARFGTETKEIVDQKR